MSSFDQNYRQMATGPSGPGIIVYAPSGYAIAPVDNDEINVCFKDSVIEDMVNDIPFWYRKSNNTIII